MSLQLRIVVDFKFMLRFLIIERKQILVEIILKLLDSTDGNENFLRYITSGRSKMKMMFLFFDCKDIVKEEVHQIILACLREAIHKKTMSTYFLSKATWQYIILPSAPPTVFFKPNISRFFFYPKLKRRYHLDQRDKISLFESPTVKY